VDVEAEAIATALRDAFKRSPEELQQMGQRGKTLIASQFSWKRSSTMTIELYQWLVGGGDRPDFVATY
jgi:poly(glycerol-phosphate) alpha-glucosyltransferase